MLRGGQALFSFSFNPTAALKGAFHSEPSIERKLLNLFNRALDLIASQRARFSTILAAGVVPQLEGLMIQVSNAQFFCGIIQAAVLRPQEIF